MIDKSLFDVPMILDGYATGFYSADDLGVFVAVDIVTPEQYQQATGEDYVVPAA